MVGRAFLWRFVYDTIVYDHVRAFLPEDARAEEGLGRGAIHPLLIFCLPMQGVFLVVEEGHYPAGIRIKDAPLGSVSPNLRLLRNHRLRLPAGIRGWTR
ncbi:hypothetical protein D3C76_1311540 [compost metagenome]